MSYQQWPITTIDQTVQEIDGVECGETISGLCASNPDYEVEICENGSGWLYSATLTSAPIPIVFGMDEEAIGVIFSGTRPTCSDQ
jgi:hypothetical protein